MSVQPLAFTHCPVQGSLDRGAHLTTALFLDEILKRLFDQRLQLAFVPEAFAADPERLARFEREAKTLASLNHPNIAAIYGFEKSGGTHALVMELVEGDDLSQRIVLDPIRWTV